MGAHGEKSFHLRTVGNSQIFHDLLLCIRSEHKIYRNNIVHEIPQWTIRIFSQHPAQTIICCCYISITRFLVKMSWILYLFRLAMASHNIISRIYQLSTLYSLRRYVNWVQLNRSYIITFENVGLIAYHINVSLSTRFDITLF